jgi:hypothetical protein
VPTRRLPLRGADLVLMAMQALWRRGEASNNALLVVECDGPIPVARVGQALDRFLDDCPWPAARLRRPFPWGGLHWAAGPRAALIRPPIHHRAVASPAEEHAVLEGQLGAAIEPRDQAPVRIAVIDRDQEDAASSHRFVLTWFHPLMDPRGAQNLLGHLALLDRRNGGAPRVPPGALAAPPESRPYRERGRLARQSRRHIRALTPVAPVSPGSGLGAPGRPRFRRWLLEESPPRDLCARLAAVARAMADLSLRRGLADAPFLVPIAVDLRPKGEPGPIFGNMLGFHFAQFARSDTADVALLARALRRQMADAVRDGHIEAAEAALEFIKYRRLSTMLRELPGTARGETFSFNCADVGEFPARLDSLFDRRVVNAYHVPAVMPRPGLGVFFNRCGDADNMVVSWIEGAVSEEDVDRVAGIVREGLARAEDR